MRIQIYHIPNVKEASKLSNNNNAHSITKYGVLGRLDVQIVVLSAPPKRSPAGHGSKKMPGAHPGALTLPQGTQIGPKRPKIGGYVVFSPLYACVALM